MKEEVINYLKEVEEGDFLKEEEGVSFLKVEEEVGFLMVEEEANFRKEQELQNQLEVEVGEEVIDFLMMVEEVDSHNLALKVVGEVCYYFHFADYLYYLMILLKPLIYFYLHTDLVGLFSSEHYLD
jgi:hypothetical protein